MEYHNLNQGGDDLHVRWSIRRDLPKILDIENKSFKNPLDKDAFCYYLGQNNIVSMVIEKDLNEILGFMVYKLDKQGLGLVDFAVHPDFRRQGVGRCMMHKLKSKLSGGRRRKIISDVRESNLEGQLFLKDQGFKARFIMGNYYEDTAEDAYVMSYTYGGPMNPANRVSEYFSKSDKEI
jgi:ribosomal-protein-alanine N-acetyltransferase